MGGVALAGRVLIGLVFLVAAVAKVRAFDGFRRSVRDLVPWTAPFWSLAPFTVVALEFLVPALLVVPTASAGVGGFGAALGLDAGFVVVIARALRRDVTAPCHCFGRASERRLGRPDLIRDLVLAVVAAAGLVACLSGASAPGAAAMVVAGAAGVVGALLLIVLDDVVEIFTPTDALLKEAR
jgi:hypothetical protein